MEKQLYIDTERQNTAIQRPRLVPEQANLHKRIRASYSHIHACTCAEDAHITCSPGAGHYRRVSGDTGCGIKRSLSARHREGVHAGYPNPLIQPVDTHGFETPGPSVWRGSERGVEKSFGIALKPAKLEAESPGKLNMR